MNFRSFVIASVFFVLSLSAQAAPIIATLDITFDDFPNETSFGIWADESDVGDIFSGIAYDVGASSPIGFGDGFVFAGDFAGVTPGLYQFVWSLDPGNYFFRIFDTFGDGLCCEWGLGSYSLSVGGVDVFAGGEFGFFDPQSGGFAAVPAPATFALFALGLAGLGLKRRSKA